MLTKATVRKARLVAGLLYILVGLSDIGFVLFVGSSASQRNTTFFLLSGIAIMAGLCVICVGAKKLYDSKNAA
jgi:hypothetical protein